MKTRDNSLKQKTTNGYTGIRILILSLLFMMIQNTGSGSNTLISASYIINGAAIQPENSGNKQGSGTSGNQSFSYTGSVQSWTVPSGVSSVSIEAWGAQGAGGDAAGGTGGYVSGNLSVTPGQVLYIYVGGQNGYNGGGTGGLSQNGNYGGNGGGATDVRVGGTALGNRVIVAGGGGGGGRNGTWGGCQPSPAGAGGNGGGTAGSNGYSSSCNCGGGGAGGGVGTTNSGGAAGGYSGGCQQGGWCSGSAGSFGYGGNGSTCTHSSGSGGAGGGGGGYYGGGAGGNGSDTTPGGGGGGGASYTGGVSNGSATSGANSGNGYVQFTYTQNSGTVNFNYTGNVQTWTVPPGITSYTITAAGSRGGTAYNGSTYGYGGYGSTLQGTFDLTPGENIKIVAGGQGAQTGTTSTLGAGGGGGSFVWRENSTAEPLLAAGGGGGGMANGSSSYSGVAATITTSGAAATSGGAGGTNGNGGNAGYSSYGGGGGAGWKSDGQNSPFAPGNDGGKSRLSGFSGGGSYYAYGYTGGFGGGGGATHGGGGGGGYSGGGGAANSTFGGGGGGSYNGGTNQTNTAGNNSGPGYVTITYTSETSVAATGALGTFEAYQGNASSDQVISVSGCILSADILIEAPDDFEISLTRGSDYVNSLSISPVANTVNVTPVYVRMKASATGTPSGIITFASTGATTRQLTLNGVKYACNATQASLVNIANRTQTTADISWTNGNGSRRVVFIKAASGGYPTPANLTSYIASTVFGSGTQIGSTGWFCVFNGTGSSVSVSGLTKNTDYGVMALEYLNPDGSEEYTLTTSTANPAYFKTIELVTYNYSGSIQTWTVPSGVTSCTVTAAGSRGGTAYNGSVYGYGGYGSTLQGTFGLTPGENIKIVAGGQGAQTGTTSTLGAGGGGGSFVWRENSTAEPLLAAGGGGGGMANGSSSYSGVAATITTSGAAATSGGAGGTNGNGGDAGYSSYGGGGGAGWKSDGQNSPYAPGNDGGKSRQSGFSGGGSYYAYGYTGGFGGGGGATHGGGGGGGYSGGGGAANSTFGGGGGGSYNGGTNQTNTAGNNSGPGYVTILYDPMVSSITLTGSLSSFSACQGAVSESQNFSASGAGLTNNININAPTGFEISLSENEDYSDILTLTHSGGTVSNTTVYVRLKATATGNPSGNISLTSSGTATQYLAVSGTTSTASSGGTASATANSICSGTSTSLSLSGYSGSIQWEQSDNGSTGWENAVGGTGATSDTYTTAILNETTYYRAKLSSGVCEDSYSDVEQIAVTNSWIGGATGVWNLAENWCGGIPTTETSVSIPEGTSVTIPEDAGATCNNLTLNNSATLTVASGGTLITEGLITGNITIQRTITGSTDLEADAYHLVSVPLHPDNNSLSELFLGSYLYGYDPVENEWSPLGSSTSVSLDETLGYMIFYPEASTTYSFTGQPNTGTFTPTVTYAGNSGGNNFALVPNPYPSNIDWNAASGWTKTNIGNTIWVYNNGNYATWNGTSGTNGGSRYIAAGQAFFVQTTAAVPSLVMDNGVRTHTSATFLKNAVNHENQLRIRALANGMQDEILTGFADGASVDYDPMEDAIKMFGAANAPQLYTLASDSKVSINRLAELNGSAEVSVHFETEFSGEITLEFSQMESFPADLKVRLEDKLTGQWANLRETSSYLFTHNPTNPADRFVLHFGSTTGISEPAQDNVKVWVAENSLYLSTPELAGEKARIELFNAAGQMILEKNLTLNALQQFNLTAKGVVLVRITLSDRLLTAKTIVF